ncbi:MAG: hypothetical protein WBQ76_17420 [Candidatus Korobacteraceae bacterium]
MPLQLGDTFILGSGGHLWVAISDPSKHNGHSIIVNITTDSFRAGTECDLDPGDHKWVKHKSYVSFRDAQKVGPKEDARIAKLIKDGVITTHYPMAQAVLKKIIAAAKISKSLPEGFKNYL